MNILKKLKMAIQKYRSYDLIIISDFYRLRNVGSERPIHDYYTHYNQKNLKNKVTVIYAFDKYGIYRLILAMLFGKNVMVNGLRLLLSWKIIFFTIIKRPKVYFHETDYVFRKNSKKMPFKMFVIKRLMKVIDRLCVSNKQKEYFSKAFNCNKESSFVIYNSIKNLQKVKNNPYSSENINIVMVGSIQHRKGVELFSELADYYKDKNENIKFHWVGNKSNNEVLYQSKNVIWHGKKENPIPYVQFADMFFLSSIDDPFPLSVLEAIKLDTKVLLYKDVGTSEILDNIEGCYIFKEYNLDYVINAINSLIMMNLDLVKTHKINNTISSINSFVNRINDVFKIENINEELSNDTRKKKKDFSKLFDTEKVLLVIGNGPSLKHTNFSILPDDYLIFRTNMFFLEDKKYFGNKIDGYFWSVYREELQDNLEEKIKDRGYRIKNFFYPMDIKNHHNKNRKKINFRHYDLFQPNYDHWEILSLSPEIARLMMSRPLPTTGLQMIACAMILGFKKIYITGIDFYQSTDTRYAFEVPNNIKQTIDKVHFTPGYEKGAHSFEYDLYFFNYIKELYPDVELISASENSYITSLIPFGE